MLPNASGFTTSFDLTKWCPLLVIKYENYARINIALAYYIKSDSDSLHQRRFCGIYDVYALISHAATRGLTDIIMHMHNFQGHARQGRMCTYKSKVL